MALCFPGGPVRSSPSTQCAWRTRWRRRSRSDFSFDNLIKRGKTSPSTNCARLAFDPVRRHEQEVTFTARTRPFLLPAPCPDPIGKGRVFDPVVFGEPGRSCRCDQIPQAGPCGAPTGSEPAPLYTLQKFVLFSVAARRRCHRKQTYDAYEVIFNRGLV